MHHQTGSFRATNTLPGKTVHETAEKWGLSWLKQHNFVIFKCIPTKHGGKM